MLPAMAEAVSLYPGRVVSTWDIAPRSPGGQAIWQYWRQRLRPDGGLPGRGDIDPAEMLGFLPNVFLVDVQRQADGRLGFRYRLAGTAMHWLMGGEIGGKTLDAALAPDVARAFEQAYAAVCLRRRPLQNNGDAIWDRPRGFLQVETLLLPLVGEDAEVAMLLGHCALQPDAAI